MQVDDAPIPRFLRKKRDRNRRLRVERLEDRLALTSLPVAVVDSYEAFQEGLLLVPATGVLANDSDADFDPLIAEVATPPAHGTLNLSPDGSFSYLPEIGFLGTDTFTYRAVTPNPSTIFTVDPSASNIVVDATLVTSFGTDSDSDNSSVEGTVTTRVTPTNSPFSEAHITDLDFTLDDGISLRFSFAFGLAGINADIPPDPSPNPALAPFVITMENPGDATAVSQGDFIQLDNELRVAGIAQLDATGLADGQIPEDPLPINNAGLFTALEGELTQVGQEISLSFPIDFDDRFDLDQGSITLSISGTVVARGAPAVAEQSTETTVTINVVDNLPPYVYEVGVNEAMTDPLDLPGGPQPSSWELQRSEIRSIDIHFNEKVSPLDNLDLRLTNLGIDANNDPDEIISLTDQQITTTDDLVTIAFDPDDLPEGVYRLEVFPTVTDLVGHTLDGNADGTAGDSFRMTGNETNRLYQLVGEWNGDGGVSVFDFSTFGYWYGVPVPRAPNYVDLNRDGGVSVFDFSAFSSNFSIGVKYPAIPLNMSNSTPTQDETKASDELLDVVAARRLEEELLLILAANWRTR